jgi:hypothetical protein
MLIRIILAVQNSALRQQLQDILARPDILVEVPRARKNLWGRIVCEPADALIVSQSLLPDALKGKMDELQRQSDSPAGVMLSGSADPKVHARLRAAGCDAEGQAEDAGHGEGLRLVDRRGRCWGTGFLKDALPGSAEHGNGDFSRSHRRPLSSGSVDAVKERLAKLGDA